MVNLEVVNDTIVRMLEAEIDEDTIVSTLKGIGLSEGESKEMIEKIKSNKNKDDSNNSDKDSFKDEFDNGDKGSSGDTTNDDYGVDVKEESTDLDDSKSDEELNTLENVKKELERNNVGERSEEDYNKKIQKTPVDEPVPQSQAKSIPINYDDDSIQDLSAKINALSSLMKQILEVNRKILNELESKK